MHTHMQIGRPARHARRRAPDLGRRPRGASTSRGLIRLSPPVPGTGRGQGAAGPAAPPAPQQVTPSKGTGQCLWHRWGRGPRTPQPPCHKSGCHRAAGEAVCAGTDGILWTLLSATTTPSTGGETDGEGARGSGRPQGAGTMGTRREQPFSHCHQGQQSHWP